MASLSRRRPCLALFEKSLKGQGLEDKVMKSLKSKRFAEAVLAGVKKRIQEYRESGAWLNTAIPFEHSLRLPQEYSKKMMELFRVCGVTDRKENRINFEVLLANLIDRRGKRPIMISLANKDWRHTQYSRVGKSIIRIINSLHEQGFIKMKKGYYTAEESRLTRIAATEKLLDYFRELSNGVIYDPVELVELRDERGKLKEYKDTAKTYRIRDILKLVNAVNGKADIRYRDYKLVAFLFAIFKEKFTLYGRLHTKGYRHYQGFSEDERAEITINGDPVVELDFSGLHPRLLYAEKGKQYLGDPYSIVDNRPDSRSFLKQILLCMLNSPDEITAERAANYWLRNNHDERKALQGIGITRARPLMDAFKEAHKPIVHYFCNGKDAGMKIMNRDAAIALDVVQHFAKQNIPILAVHDSFLVQRQYEAELKRVMQSIYSKHTGGFRCAIK
jgi:hypothetical protein